MRIVFDLDGVIFKSVSSQTIEDPHFWHEYWSDVGRQTPNIDIVRLIQVCVGGGAEVIILTARPEGYRVYTEDALLRAGLSTEQIPLLMANVDLSMHSWNAGKWKKEILEALGDIDLVVEDYKSAVDIIRDAFPVLCYEQLRG